MSEWEVVTPMGLRLHFPIWGLKFKGEGCSLCETVGGSNSDNH